LLSLTIDLRRDPVVEGKGIPGEPSAGLERRGDALEHASPVGPMSEGAGVRGRAVRRQNLGRAQAARS
jgi:hypothetical protein